VNLAHLHLLLNHFPIIGTIIGLALVVASLIEKKTSLKRAGLIVLAVMALVALPTFFSGIGAKGAIKDDPGVSAALIDRHEGSAILALFFMEIAGALALVGLWQGHSAAKTRRWPITALLLFSIVTMGVMVRVGNTGGDIRHPETRLVQEGTAIQESGLSAIVHSFEPSPAKFAGLMIINKFWWAFMMDLHFIGLALLIGTVAVLDLRILGFVKQLPAAPLHRLVPWGLAGFGLNVLTGILAFIGMPETYTYDIAFWFKILAILLLGLNAVMFYLTDAFQTVEGLKAGEDANPLAKFLAATSLFLWLAVIVLGRYIQSFTATIEVRR
jgi:uncharacterized membrane protein